MELGASELLSKKSCSRWLKTQLWIFLALFCCSFNGYAYIIPDTGQTKCYNDSEEITCPQPGQDYYGQDGNYAGIQPSYRDNGDQTITDLVTNLTWQKTDDGTPKTQYDALLYCESLSLGGQTDWRLPSRTELASIVDVTHYSPAINPVFSVSTPNADPNEYWATDHTSTKFTSDRSVIDFKRGSISISVNWLTKYARCVKGDTIPRPNMSDNGDGTATDHSTLLMWQTTAYNESFTWKEALALCSNCSLAGHTDWRLPNKREFETLFSNNPIIPKPLTGPESIYWTSTTQVDLTPTQYAFSIYPPYTYASMRTKTQTTYPIYVRCVRSVSLTVVPAIQLLILNP